MRDEALFSRNSLRDVLDHQQERLRDFIFGLDPDMVLSRGLRRPVPSLRPPSHRTWARAGGGSGSSPTGTTRTSPGVSCPTANRRDSSSSGEIFTEGVETAW